MEASRRESNMNLTEPARGDGGNRVLLVVTVLCVIIAIVAVVIAAVALTSAGGGKGGSDSGKGNVINVNSGSGGSGGGSSGGGGGGQSPPAPSGGRKVWVLADGHDYQAYSYINKQGYLDGFNKDLLSAVCTASGADCRFVWDKYTNCISSAAGQHNFGGPGLMGKWYDACTGWYTTVGRTQIFSFSKPYSKAPITKFWTKKGTTFGSSVQGKTIGFLDGWANDEKCVARQTGLGGVPLPAAQVKHAQTTAELKDMVINGVVDAAFASEADLKLFENVLDKSSASYSCVVAGIAMMTRKDNSFNSVFNAGFSKLMSNGQYRKLCTEASKHPGTIECVDS